MHDSILIDALEAESWAGIVVARNGESAFGLRFAVDASGLLDGASIYEAVREVGTHTGGSYCSLTWSVAPAHGDMFSIRWEGKLEVPVSGDYTLYVTSDDGCRLYLDGKLLVDEWWDRVPREFTAAVTLAAGEHPIVLEYYESVGSASVKLEWSGPAIERQVIPTANLSFEGMRGLQGTYHYGTELRDFAFSRIDSSIDFDFGHGGPLPERETDALVRLEWSSTAPGEVCGRMRMTADRPASLLLLAYFPWDYTGSWRMENGVLTGECAGDTLRITTDPTAAGVWMGGSVDEIRRSYTSDRTSPINTGAAAVGLRLLLTGTDAVSFAASLGPGAPVCDPAGISAILERNRKDDLESHRTRTFGAFENAAETIIDNTNWMRLLIPHTTISYVPAGRVWLWSSWTVFEWDGFLNALLASVGNPELAMSTVDALLHTQQPNGVFPNVANDPSGVTSAGRSQPPIGSYCALKLYRRLALGREFLEKVYFPLVRWHEWWLAPGPGGNPRRDGNANGLLEWGSDAADLQDAKFESGMDDSPLFDEARYIPETWTMDLDSVDCTSLYALDAYCLAIMADELGIASDAERWRAQHARLSELINERLWSDEHAMYLNRFWDGRFSPRIGCANLYPLIARVATADRAARLGRSITDPEVFGGKWMIPTISRSDPAYPDQHYWRGTVWPPTNYLAYEGLRAYRLDAEAAAVAASGAELFLANWKREGSCRENYRSDTGEGGGQKYQSWGPLFSLIALQEFADVELDGSMRFGSFTNDQSRCGPLYLCSEKWEVSIGSQLDVSRDKTRVVRADGAVVLRGWRVQGGALSFEAHSPGQCRLTIFEPDIERAFVDGAEAPVERGSIRLGEGIHLVEFR